jgi:hypothetical protein
MERLKLEMPTSQSPRHTTGVYSTSRSPTVNLDKHVGVYYAPSKSYSRKRCLKVMLALDPDIKAIFIRFDGKNLENAMRSRRKPGGLRVFHFSARWKLETVIG